MTHNRSYILKRVQHNAECWIQVGEHKLPLSPKESQSLRNHSPDGFEFGYAGSGPAQLALAILLDWVRTRELPDSVALEHYQGFKHELIATVPQAGGIITSEQIHAFLQQTNKANPS